MNLAGSWKREEGGSLSLSFSYYDKKSQEKGMILIVITLHNLQLPAPSFHQLLHIKVYDLEFWSKISRDCLFFYALK